MTREWKMDRAWPLPTRTIGRLFDATSGIEEFVCYTGEDRVRPAGEAKVFGETAIPAGRYRVVLDFSNRFQRIMPHVLDVPGFEGIRIHGARSNVPVEVSTEGCVCVGHEHDSEGVYDCTPALLTVIGLLAAAEKRGEEVWVTVP